MAEPSSDSDVDGLSLEDFIERCPLIDNHCHALLPFNQQKQEDLLTITSEASGSALPHARSTLAHHRAVKQLCQLEGIPACKTTAESWEAYCKHRTALGEDEFTKRSMKGIETVLIDDGIRHASTPHSYEWHSKYTRSPAKRIVRIETLAEDTLHTLGKDMLKEWEEHQDSRPFGDIFEAFEEDLWEAIWGLQEDDEVVGWKSAIAYRSGLSIIPREYGKPEAASEICEEVKRLVNAYIKDKTFPRINYKPLNDFIVNILAYVITVRTEAGIRVKPIQFHTGLGDNDLTWTLADPSHLQAFIKRWPTVPVVLLHASYPFTRQAAYLASVYSNVYLDIGEIFPMVSREGQETALRQALELTPTTKACWSTDGHFYQETYSLGVLQSREALKEVLGDMDKKGDVDQRLAKEIVQDLFFNTSNKLYDLKLPFKLLSPAQSTASSTQSSASAAGRQTSAKSNLAYLQAFLAKHPSIKYIRLSWTDYTATIRARVFTLPYVLSTLNSASSDGSLCGVTADNILTLQDDAAGIPDLSAVGELRLCPDLRSLRIHPRISGRQQKQEYACAMAYLYDGRISGRDPRCPQTILERAIHEAAKAGIADLKFGFEIEFCLFEAEALDKENKLVPISTAHAWCTGTALNAAGGKVLTILEEMMEALDDSGIETYMFHSESAPGQYEIPLGPLPPLAAVEQLLHAREVITYIASLHGYRATLHPKPVPNQAGTGAHLHVSFPPSPTASSFWAGVLHHLSAICTFTLPNKASYGRIRDGAWSSSTWRIWGDQNREAPLRRINEKDNHWEMKCFDGLANPYLACAAILHAGVLGAKAELRLPPACNVQPGSLSDEAREATGITDRMPRKFEDALEELGDPGSQLTNALGAENVKRYVQVKRTEMRKLRDMADSQGEAAVTAWLVQRY